MAAGRGENEGFHLLPEFACAAIPEPGAIPPGTKLGRAENEGMRVLDEITVDLSGEPLPRAEQAAILGGLTEPQQAALRLLVESGSLAEVARGLGVTAPQARDVLLATVDSLRTRLVG